MKGSQTSIIRPFRPQSPQLVWPEVCWVSDQLAVSGELSANPEGPLEQLRVWEAAGITDVFDMRGEADDSDFIHDNSDVITSHWFGVDDWGTPRDPAWFDSFVPRAREILKNPQRKVLVHCAAGIHRGPSALYTIMLDQGWDELGALRDIRNARPIAAMIYAPDAVEWHSHRTGRSNAEAREARRRVTEWLERNRFDVRFTIDTIWDSQVR